MNCEYKLKEKYPHMCYLVFFFVLYVLIIGAGAAMFVLVESKAEMKVRDQILSSQQQFLEQNKCVDGKLQVQVELLTLIMIIVNSGKLETIH